MGLVLCFVVKCLFKTKIITSLFSHHLFSHLGWFGIYWVICTGTCSFKLVHISNFLSDFRDISPVASSWIYVFILTEHTKWVIAIHKPCLHMQLLIVWFISKFQKFQKFQLFHLFKNDYMVYKITVGG